MELGILDKPDLASRLWNADETGFCTAIASRKVLARRGAREVHETAGGSGRDYITVLGAGAADGVRLPPYILYKGVNLYARWTEGGPAGTWYGVSKSGWMEGDNFFQRFTAALIPATQHLLDSGPVILFVDGHHSHLSLSLVHTAKQEDQEADEEADSDSEATNKDENTCQGCGGAYNEDERKHWIGCDGPSCWRWYHYWCAGFRRKPRKTTKFLCSFCNK